MARYIDADKTSQYVYDNYHELDFMDTGVCSEMRHVIDVQPTEDVTPVIHAHWLTSMEKFEKNWFAMDRCSNCSWLKPIFVEGVEISFNYCPNCGAKMDEEVQV